MDGEMTTSSQAHSDGTKFNRLNYLHLIVRGKIKNVQTFAILKPLTMDCV